MSILKSLGNFFAGTSKEKTLSIAQAARHERNSRIREELAEMKTFHHTADNSEHRIQWGAIGAIYSTYYHMIETMILNEMKDLREKYLHVSHQLLPNGEGGTIVRIFVNNGDHHKIYQAELSVTVSVSEENEDLIECVICRELPENESLDIHEKGKCFIFNDQKDFSVMATRMMTSANMLMAIHDYIKAIEQEIIDKDAV